MNILLSFLKKKQKIVTLRQAIDATNISTSEHHRMSMDDVFKVANKNIQFKDVTSKNIIKKLGLIHNPQVRTVLPEDNDKLTFNKRTSHLARQLHKGLPKLR